MLCCLNNTILWHYLCLYKVAEVFHFTCMKRAFSILIVFILSVSLFSEKYFKLKFLKINSFINYYYFFFMAHGKHNAVILFLLLLFMHRISNFIYRFMSFFPSFGLKILKINMNFTAIIVPIIQNI